MQLAAPPPGGQHSRAGNLGRSGFRRPLGGPLRGRVRQSPHTPTKGNPCGYPAGVSASVPTADGTRKGVLGWWSRLLWGPQDCPRAPRCWAVQMQIFCPGAGAGLPDLRVWQVDVVSLGPRDLKSRLLELPLRCSDILLGAERE